MGMGKLEKTLKKDIVNTMILFREEIAKMLSFPPSLDDKHFSYRTNHYLNNVYSSEFLALPFFEKSFLILRKNLISKQDAKLF